jgi:hypothetical protein
MHTTYNLIARQHSLDNWQLVTINNGLLVSGVERNDTGLSPVAAPKTRLSAFKSVTHTCKLQTLTIGNNLQPLKQVKRKMEKA